MKFSARVIVFLLFLFFFLLVFKSTPAFAQTAAPQIQSMPAQADLHNYTQNVMIEVMSSMGCILTGIDVVDSSQKCLGLADGKIGPINTKGGALGSMGGLIGMTFEIPVHTGDYIGYIASNFGITKPVYAEDSGIGFRGLAPLLSIWVAFRNIVYLLFTIIFIVIGFTIMFRVKIDPRTVMTVENQIPKIIIALILVTFSFAIAGLLIDLMWVFSYLVIEVFKQIDPSIQNLVTNFQGQNALEIANNIKVQNGGSGWIGIVGNSSGAVGHIMGKLTEGLSGTLLGDLLVAVGVQIAFTASKVGNIISVIGGTNPIGQIIKSIGTGLAAGVVTSVFGTNILGIIGNLIAFLVIAIAVLWALFRLWFTLIKAYVMILINVVFGPFWILGGMLPGGKLSFTGWLRDMIGNLIAYPATLVMFLLAQVFINKFGATQTAGQFVPPLIGNPGESSAVGSLVGLGMILLTPAVVDMMRKALQAPDVDLSMIWKSVGVGMGAGGIPGMAGRLGMQLEYAEHVPGIGKWLKSRGLTAETAQQKP